jgi:hypothetical protein
MSSRTGRIPFWDPIHYYRAKLFAYRVRMIEDPRSPLGLVVFGNTKQPQNTINSPKHDRAAAQRSEAILRGGSVVKAIAEMGVNIGHNSGDLLVRQRVTNGGSLSALLAPQESGS